MLLNIDKSLANLRLPTPPPPQRNKALQGQPEPLGEGTEQNKRVPSCCHQPVCGTSHPALHPKAPCPHPGLSRQPREGPFSVEPLATILSHFLFLCLSPPPAFISSCLSSPLCLLGGPCQQGPSLTTVALCSRPLCKHRALRVHNFYF